MLDVNERVLPDVVEIVVREEAGEWAAWSPQCPGLMIVEDGAQALRHAVKPALRYYFETEFGALPVARIMMTLESDSSGVLVRVRYDDFYYERDLLSQRLVALLRSGTGEAKEFAAGRPNGLGDVVYFCALPGDRLRLVQAQLAPGDSINVVLPVGEEFVWSTSFLQEDPDRPHQDSSETRRFSPETTLSEVMRLLSSGGTASPAILSA